MRDDDSIAMGEIVEAEYFLMKNFGLQPIGMLGMPSTDVQFLIMKENAEVERKIAEDKARQVERTMTMPVQKSMTNKMQA